MATLNYREAIIGPSKAFPKASRCVQPLIPANLRGRAIRPFRCLAMANLIRDSMLIENRGNLARTLLNLSVSSSSRSRTANENLIIASLRLPTSGEKWKPF